MNTLSEIVYFVFFLLSSKTALILIETLKTTEFQND